MQKAGWASYRSTLQKAQADEPTELSWVETPQLFPSRTLLRKGFSGRLCFDVNTGASSVFMTSFHWEMFFLRVFFFCLENSFNLAAFIYYFSFTENTSLGTEKK